MKKNKKYLPLYYKWMKNSLPDFGLCLSFRRANNFDPQFDLMRPHTSSDSSQYWAYDGKPFSCDRFYYERDLKIRGITVEQARHEFTPLRQTIVLFLAAMNNEL